MSESTDDHRVAQYLWGLLDDIDTAGDLAKGDDKLYRALVERYQRQRFLVGSTDGYTVVLTAKDLPSEAELRRRADAAMAMP